MAAEIARASDALPAEERLKHLIVTQFTDAFDADVAGEKVAGAAEITSPFSPDAPRVGGVVVDNGAYTSEREKDEFRGNENNRRVAMRVAMTGEVGIPADEGRAKKLRRAEVESVLADGTTASLSPNAPATTTDSIAGTTVDPEGLTALQGNGSAPVRPAWGTPVRPADAKRE